MKQPQKCWIRTLDLKSSVLLLKETKTKKGQESFYQERLIWYETDILQVQ